MKPLSKTNLFSREEYERFRESSTSSALNYRSFRKINLSDYLILCFENSETVKHYLNETIFLEKDYSEDNIVNKLNLYNNIIPDQTRLSASLVINNNESKPEIKRLINLNNLQDHVYIQIEGHAKVYATSQQHDRIKIHENNISELYFLQFIMPPKMIESFQTDNKGFFIGIDHPLCAAHYQMHEDFRKMIAFDFNPEYDFF
jgi:hypothetical protein